MRYDKDKFFTINYFFSMMPSDTCRIVALKVSLGLSLEYHSVLFSVGEFLRLVILVYIYEYYLVFSATTFV